jgi:hypothetical protein
VSSATSPEIVQAVLAEYVRYKELAEGALAQLTDAELAAASSATDNSIVAICWHVSGNLRSRFTEFLTTDGEKAWRRREEEFDARDVTRAELLETWNAGWAVLFQSVSALSDADLGRTVTIRGQSVLAHEALFRSLAHTSYHVGQIVYQAKMVRGETWRSLSIPRGQSDAFNARMAKENPDSAKL